VTVIEIGRPAAYDSDEQWNDDVADVQKEFVEVMMEAIQDNELVHRVSMVGLDDAVTRGILIEPIVTRLNGENRSTRSLFQISALYGHSTVFPLPAHPTGMVYW